MKDASLTANKVAGSLTETYPFRQTFTAEIKFLNNQIFTGLDNVGGHTGYGYAFYIPKPTLGIEPDGWTGTGYGSVTVEKTQSAVAEARITAKNNSTQDRSVTIYFQPQMQSKGQTINLGSPDQVMDRDGSARNNEESYMDGTQPSHVEKMQILKFDGNQLHKIPNFGSVSKSSDGSVPLFPIIGSWYNAQDDCSYLQIDLEDYGETSYGYDHFLVSDTVYASPNNFAASGTFVAVGYGDYVNTRIPAKSHQSIIIPSSVSIGRQSSKTKIRYSLFGKCSGPEHEDAVIYNRTGYRSYNNTSSTFLDGQGNYRSWGFMRKHRTYAGMVTNSFDVTEEYDAIHSYWRAHQGFLYGWGQHTDAKLNISDRHEGKDNDPNGMDVMLPNIVQKYLTVDDDQSESGTGVRTLDLGFGARVEFIGFSYFMPTGTSSKNNKRFTICLTGIHAKNVIRKILVSTAPSYTGSSAISNFEFSGLQGNSCEHHRAYRERSYDGNDSSRPYQDYTIWSWSAPNSPSNGFTNDWPGFNRNVNLKYTIETETSISAFNHDAGEGQYKYFGPGEDGFNIKNAAYDKNTRYVELRLDELKGFFENKV